METLIVLSLVVVGILLMLVEIFFVPSGLILAILSLLSTIVGIMLGFKYFGNEIGLLILAASLFSTGGLLFLGFRWGIWYKFALKSTIDNKVDDDEFPLLVGETGVTLSSLRPYGNADFNGQTREVFAPNQVIDAGTKIRVLRVEGKKVFVELFEE